MTLAESLSVTSSMYPCADVGVCHPLDMELKISKLKEPMVVPESGLIDACVPWP
jgi:hypothetical protein